MQILEHHALQGMNTLGLPARARRFTRVRSTAELREAISYAHGNRLPFLVLGGGSNVVLTRNIEGLLIRIGLDGIELVGEDRDHRTLRVAAGVEWDHLVRYCLSRGYHGLENLSRIPGTVGAAPVQNIGAYGVELSDRLLELEALELATGRPVRFRNEACRFAYRTSIFKESARDRYVITSVTLRLDRNPSPVVTHEPLRAELASMGIRDPAPGDVAEAVRRVRAARLPDPDDLGNAGSFFKNPVVSTDHLAALQERFEGIVSYPAGEGRAKLAAAWMIDRLGWKGFRDGAVGVYPGHALVLVNHGGATGEEVLRLAERIRRSVRERYGVDLELEPRVY